MLVDDPEVLRTGTDSCSEVEEAARLRGESEREYKGATLLEGDASERGDERMIGAARSLPLAFGLGGEGVQE